MATTVPTKIVLKSTTRMSLNDRFSNIVPSVQNIRSNIATEQQVSAANRRLAQQLANRPGLQASAGDMYMIQQQQGQPGGMRGNRMMRGGRGGGQQSNIQQRLGKSNIKNRLSLPAGGNQQMRGGRGRGRGGRGNLVNQGGGGGNIMNKQQRGRGNFVPRGIRGRGGLRGRGRGFNRLTGQSTIIRRGRGGGANRSFRGRGGRGRGRGQRGGNTGGAVSQQDLDAQLDSYMAKTKSALDTELDAYMSEVTS